MKKQIIPALVVSIIIAALSAIIILALEPSNKTVPYFHDKTISEVNDFMLSIKKDSTSSDLMFTDLTDIDDDTLKYIIGIQPEYLEASSVKTSTNSATAFLVLRLKEGSKALVEQSVIDYMDYLEKQWQAENSEQALLVQNYSKITMGDYLIYVISENNEYVTEQVNSLFIYADKD